MSIAQARRVAALVVATAALLAVIAAVPAAAAFQDKDCADFKTHKQAQRYYKNHGGPRYDPSHLDADHDGKACEDLP
jgi:hypothetical protein